jgi:plasmid maintenance system killer protein
MKIVAKNPMWDRKHLYFIHINQFDTFYGDLLPTPSWTEKDAICISADIPSRMRIIPRRLIISIDDKEQEPVLEVVSTKRIYKVNGSKGNVYTVTINGKYKNCTCPGFGFRRSCKHILEAS